MKTKSRVWRGLALLLALVFVFGLTPISSAHAEDDEGAEISDEVSEGDDSSPDDSTVIIRIVTSSANPDITEGNACYSLEGAVYGVYSDAECETEIARITTDSNGCCETEPLEPMSYYVRRIAPVRGYLPNDEIYTVTGSGEIMLELAEIPAIELNGLRIIKITDDTATSLPSLEGTQFTVNFYAGQYSSVEDLPEADKSWVIEAKARAEDGAIVYEALLQEEHKAAGDEFFYSDGDIVLPLGTVAIQETKAADGYTMIGGYFTQAGRALADENGVLLLNVTEDATATGGAALNYGNEFTKTDKPIYGGVSIQILDAETDTAAAQGDGTLFGAELKIVSLNEGDVTVNGQVYSKGEAVCAGSTNDKGLLQIPANLLPRGRYKVLEEASSKGYLLTENDEAEFEITEDGQLVSLQLKVKPVRADFALYKGNEDGDPMPGVSFEVKSNSTGESHSFVTGADGRFESVGSSLRFGAPGDGGALIYDTYTITELECEANRGFALSDPITLEVDGSRTRLQLNDLTSYRMRLRATASFTPGGEKWSMGNDATLTASITANYEHLIPHRTYSLSVKLWDNAAGKYLKGSDGGDISVAKSFTPDSAVGVQTLEISFGTVDFPASSELTPVLDLRMENDEAPLVSLREPGTPGLTLYVYRPEISTMAAAGLTGTQLGSAGDMVALGTVSYEGLKPGEKYVLYGVVAVSDATDTILGGAMTVFTPTSDSGSETLRMPVDAKGCEGKTLVVLERLMYQGEMIAERTEAGNPAQQIYIPSVRANVKGSGAAAASEEVTVTGAASLDNLLPGTEYTVTTEAVLRSKPSTVLAARDQKLIPDGTSAGLDLSLSFDASSLAGDAALIRVRLKYKNVEIAGSDSLIDADGNVLLFPAVRTSGVLNGETSHIARERMTSVFEVEYSNLTPGQRYTLRGTMTDRTSKKALTDTEGKEITAETVFTAEAESGKVWLTFSFNGSHLAGKTAVVMEALYAGEALDLEPIAVHESIDADEPSVYFTEKGVTTGTATGSVSATNEKYGPQTGDEAHMGVYLALLCISGVAAITVAFVLFRKRESAD